MPEIWGPQTWTLNRDEYGYKEYSLITLVKAALTDGPNLVLEETPDLPQPGDVWQFANFDELDDQAFCTAVAKVKKHEKQEDEPAEWYKVEQQFKTADPLTMPARVNGDSVLRQEEATHDRFGRRIITSSHEQIRGPQAEFEAGYFTVSVENNVFTQDLDTVANLMHTVNDGVMWDFAPRMVKLSGYHFERVPYGIGSFYYKRRLLFGIWKRKDPFGNYISGWDRNVLDQGTRALHGDWNPTTGQWDIINIPGVGTPDPTNPLHFVRFHDINGNITTVILDGQGRPFNATPLSLVTGCTQANPSPNQWTVYFSDTDRVILTYSSGCTWDGTYIDNTTPVTLTYNAGAPAWELTVGPNLWSANPLDWINLGPNTMTSADELQPLLVLIAVGAQQPGNIHIEKYEESNFFELGDLPESL